MATDFITLGYNKVVTLLGALVTAQTIKTLQSYNDTDALPKQLRTEYKGSELPILNVDLESSSDSGEVQTRTFATLSASGPCSWRRTVKLVFKIWLVVDSPLMSASSVIITAIQTSLGNGGIANLGIAGCIAFMDSPLVSKSKLIGRSEHKISTYRRRSEIAVTMRLEFEGNTQIS